MNVIKFTETVLNIIIIIALFIISRDYCGDGSKISDLKTIQEMINNGQC